MTRSGIYDELDPEFRKYVDALVDHARSALWPERKTALLSFRRGIEKADPDDLLAILAGVGGAEVPEARRAETVFRITLTAYLERLEDQTVTNADQAELFILSLNEKHAAKGRRWLRDNFGRGE